MSKGKSANVTDHNWWYKTMKYIREVPGKIYKDQLYYIVKKNRETDFNNTNDLPDENDIVTFMNNASPDNNIREYLIEDEVTGGIYSVPVNRQFLDSMIKDNYELEYSYNKYLYLDEMVSPEDEMFSFSGDGWKEPDKFDEIFDLKEEKLSIDLTCIKGYIKDFDLDRICNYIIENNEIKTKKLNIVKFLASDKVFIGDTRLEIDSANNNEIVFTGGMCFKGSTFEKKLTVSNITFKFVDSNNDHEANYETNKIDFRNCRFFEGFSMKNSRLTGSVPDMEMSFEDARIQKDFILIDVEMGHAALNCFQMAVGSYIGYIDSKTKFADNHSIKVVNVDFSDDSEIDFQDAELNNTEVIFENITGLPETNLCFAPIIFNDKTDELICPENKLIVKNCDIEKTLFISNVTELSFQNSRNCGKIIEGNKWGAFPERKGYRRVSKGLIPQMITNPLLIAVYNNRPQDISSSDKEAMLEHECYKAKDFVLLKECFQADGRYDEVDDAFILYMEYKPYQDGYINRKKRKSYRTDFLYKILYATGKYGISPRRVIGSMFGLALLFTLVYLIIAIGYIEPIYYFDGIIPGEMLGRDGNVFMNILAAMLYSVANILPFVNQFGSDNVAVCIASAIESFFGTFFIGYFSVAVVRRTLH